MSLALCRAFRTSFGRDARPNFTPLHPSAQSRMAVAGVQSFGSRTQSPSTNAACASVRPARMAICSSSRFTSLRLAPSFNAHARLGPVGNTPALASHIRSELTAVLCSVTRNPWELRNLASESPVTLSPSACICCTASTTRRPPHLSRMCLAKRSYSSGGWSRASSRAKGVAS